MYKQRPRCQPPFLAPDAPRAWLSAAHAHAIHLLVELKNLGISPCGHHFGLTEDSSGGYRGATLLSRPEVCIFLGPVGGRPLWNCPEEESQMGLHEPTAPTLVA